MAGLALTVTKIDFNLIYRIIRRLIYQTDRWV